MTDQFTINDIAKLANTSKTTVSFYLNGKTDKMSEDTKEKIEKVIIETGYRPSVAARSLKSKTTRLIGVVIGDITNTFSNQLVKGIEECAKKNTYQLIVGNSNYSFETEEMYVKRMLDMGVEGFIVQPSSKFYSLIPLIKSRGKDVVFIDSQTSIDNEKWVKTNNYEMALNLGEEISKTGYNKCLLITADPHILSSRLERVLGFEDGLNMDQVELNRIVVSENVSTEDIQEILNHTLHYGDKTFIFVANCFLLPKVYVGLKKFKQLIPESIGLAGFDNTEWTTLASPTVTTIVQPAYEEGVQAMKILIDSIEKTYKELPNQILKSVIHWNESFEKSDIF